MMLGGKPKDGDVLLLIRVLMMQVQRVIPAQLAALVLQDPQVGSSFILGFSFQSMLLLSHVNLVHCRCSIASIYCTK